VLVGACLLVLLRWADHGAVVGETHRSQPAAFCLVAVGLASGDGGAEVGGVVAPSVGIDSVAVARGDHVE
jgi:hypothetical protein